MNTCLSGTSTATLCVRSTLPTPSSRLVPALRNRFRNQRESHDGSFRSLSDCSRCADTDAPQAIIENNDYSRLRIISAGVKAFVRQDSQNRTEIGCKWRIPGEGVAEVLPHVGDGVVKVATIEDLRVLVEHAYPSVSGCFHADIDADEPLRDWRPLWSRDDGPRADEEASSRGDRALALSDLARRSVSIYP